MYAVFKSGGKQHRASEGDVLKLEKIEAPIGGSIDFEEVLLVSDGADVKVGAPNLEGGKVTAEIVGQGRHKKITIVKFNRRKHFRKQAGHRQYFTEVRITGINAG